MSARFDAAPLSRRGFLRTTALLGGAGSLSLGAAGLRAFAAAKAPPESAAADYVLVKPENLLYTTCLQCHVDCQLKVKIWDGTVAKLTGSPFSPQNYLPHLPYDTPLDAAAAADGKLCSKGQAGIQTYYDPYRIRRVLKRAGPRGSGRWKAIPFQQLVDEVVEGGRLFADLGDRRRYPGFREVYALRNRDLAKRLRADASRFARGELSLGAFRSRWKRHLDVLIDPAHPDLGPKNNGFVFAAGRIEHGRKELMKRFTIDSFGSVNAFEHTTICEQSHHIAYRAITGGATDHMKPDLEHCEFAIFWGTGAFTANFGLTPMAEKVTTGKRERGMKTCVVDPRLSADAGKADWWLPTRPGADGALALAMISWILEHGRYDRRYLENANLAAATRDGEPTWTNATHLVKVVDGRARGLVRADELGLGTADQLVVSRNGHLVAVAPSDARHPVHGDLFVSTEVASTRLKTALQLLREEAGARSLDEYARITGIPAHRIVEVARELTSHGKRAAVDLYRGAVAHTDGFYAAAAIISLNLLIGNPDWRGGLSRGGGHWHELGGKEASPYAAEAMHPDKFPAFGPPVTREKVRYEEFSLFRERGYPAKRPWYPLTSNVYQEIIPSFASGYPYRGKILLLHMGTPALATPAGHRVIEMLRDPERVPLFIACDVVIGETSMYADYIVPDLTYLERWGTPHVTPDVNVKVSKVRQPVAQPLTEEVSIDGEPMPISLEAFLLAVAKRLDLPGFGSDAFARGSPFDRPEDWYLKLVANIAFGDRPGDVVPDADEQELRLFREARRHLPASVFDEAKWRRALRPDEWRKVVYVLNRGGRFAPYGEAHEGRYMKSKLGRMLHFFFEDVARERNSLTGEHFPGHAVYRGQLDASGRPVPRDPAYPLALITFKEAFGGHSRTIGNYWSNVALQPANRLWMNRADAARLGLRSGQRVRVRSSANPEGAVDLGGGRRKDIVVALEVREGIRPGTVALSWHYGHWAYGAADVEIDGERIPGDLRRGRGACPNPLMLTDPATGDVCLTDPVGGSASFLDTDVAVVPA